MDILEQLIQESSQIITHLNCSNCQYFDKGKHEEVDEDDLNKQGGMRFTDKEDYRKAKKMRLITLPGRVPVHTKYWCKNSDINQWVTEHMWCTAWEHPGTKREFKK